MPKWFKKNLTPLLAVLEATFYFFGQQRLDYKHHFQHIKTLIPKSSYPEFAVIGFTPLFGYVAWASLFTIAVLAAFFLLSRGGDPYASVHSQSDIADTRSVNKIERLKHGTPSFRAVLARFSWQKNDKWRFVFIVLLFLMGLAQTGVENSLRSSGNLLLRPKSASFNILWPVADIDPFLTEAYIWLFLMFVIALQV